MRRSTTTLAAVLLAATPLAALAQTGAAAPSTTTKAAATAPAPGETTQSQSQTQHKATMSRRQIEELQAALQSGGAQVTTDGIWGPKTAAALREFQKQKGLKITGRPDRDTAQKLNIPHWS